MRLVFLLHIFQWIVVIFHLVILSVASYFHQFLLLLIVEIILFYVLRIILLLRLKYQIIRFILDYDFTIWIKRFLKLLNGWALRWFENIKILIVSISSMVFYEFLVHFYIFRIFHSCNAICFLHHYMHFHFEFLFT